MVLIGTGDSSVVCATPDRFASEGVSGLVVSYGNKNEEKGYAEAYLVPDSLAFKSVPEGLVTVSDSLITGDSRDQRGTLRSATVDGGAELEMQLIHPDPNS